MEVDPTGIILAASKFAAEKHQYQRRKNAQQTPYINHPIEVADLVWSRASQPDVIAVVAALLHDTLEDTDTRPEEIEERFGKEVLEVVREVTDDKSLPKLERKRLQVVTAKNKSYRAKLVKIADKIANVRDLSQSPPANWDLTRKQNYILWADAVVNEMRGTCSELEKLYDQTSLQAKRKHQIDA